MQFALSKVIFSAVPTKSFDKIRVHSNRQADHSGETGPRNNVPNRMTTSSDCRGGTPRYSSMKTYFDIITM